jgi:hypothetical protein
MEGEEDRSGLIGAKRPSLIYCDARRDFTWRDASSPRVCFVLRPFSMISFHLFDWNRFKIFLKLKKKILKNPEMSNYYFYAIRKISRPIITL